MRKNIVFFTLLNTVASLACLAQTPVSKPPVQAASQPVAVVLADGTPVKLRLGSTAAASGARIGENLDLEVAEDVRVSDVVVVAKGNQASAEVTGLHAGVGNAGRIDINLRSVTLADGQVIPVRSTKDRPSRDDQALVISSASQDASIAPGTSVIAFINGNQSLDMSRLRAASGPTQALKINSTPPNADVTVDGRWTGNSPSVFHVAAGDHTVVVRMVGFQPWQRTVHVTSAATSVDASLVKEDGAEAAPASRPAEASLGDLARAARARKAQPNPDQNSSTTTSQTGQRDPMEPPAPKN